MARLMEFPNATSRLATDASALWKLAYVLHKGGSGVDGECLFAFEELVKLTLGHLINTKEQDRSRKYLKKYHALLSGSLVGGGIFPDQFGTRHLVKASLSVFWLHHEDLLKPFKEKEIKRLRVTHLDGLISDVIDQQESRPKRTRKRLKITLLMTLDGMLEYGDLLSVHERRAEGNARTCAPPVVVPADVSVYFALAEIMMAIMPAQNTVPKTAFEPASTTSQVIASLYELSSYTQEDRGTDFMDVSLLLQLLRISRCIPIASIYKY